MRLRSLLPLVALLSLAVPLPAWAARPTGAAAVTDTANVRVHYDASRTPVADAQALAADVQEAYGRLVGGASGTPNAGLRIPVPDGSLGGDGRVDYYLVDTSGGGGQAIGDSSAEHASGYVQIDPDMSRAGTRFRAGHELMHVIAWAYSTAGGLHTESTANWAAEWSLPDVDPGDSGFSQPWVPLDCSYGSWETLACGNGYRQWPFVQRQVEAYGPGFVDGWLSGVDALNSGGLLTTALDRQLLDDALQASGGPAATLRQAYADYAWRVWDPTAWSTTAVRSMFATREPATTDVTVSRGTPDTGTVGVAVDHLAARYVRFVNAGAEPTGPQDRLRITAAVPAPVSAVPVALLGDQADWGRTRVPLTGSCSGLPCTEVSADPATVRDVVLVLANDQDPGAAGSTAAFDDAPFAYRVELLPGPATPPPGDDRAAPVDVPLGTETVVDAAYAGGLGADEASCPGFTDGATRGVWLRFRAPNSGTYVFDDSASDLRTVMVAYRAGTRVSCSFHVAGERGSAFATGLAQGAVVDIYIGRHASSRSRGHTLRMTVTGPAAPVPAPTPAPTPTPTATPTPSPSPSPSDTTPPAMRLVSRTIRASRSGALSFVLACPATETRCRGTLSLPRTRKVRLGSVTFSIAGGRRVTARIRLSSSARRMLRRARRLRVTATIAARDAAGNRRTTRLRVTLLAPR